MTTLPSRMELQIWLQVIFTLVQALCLQMQTAIAQEDYSNVTGYACTGARSTCRSYAVYRTQKSQNLTTIASLFNTSSEGIVNASGINPALATLNIPFADQTLLYVPLACSCVNGTYQALIEYIVEPQDTMIIIANGTYQGLTTYPAIAVANPSVVATDMSVGQLLNIPLRCACPSTQQLMDGSQILITYSIFPQENMSKISERFNVSVSDLEYANGLTEDMAQELTAFSTLLIPLAALVPLNSSNFASPPQAPPAILALAPSLIGSFEDQSKTPLYIGVAVGAFGVTLAVILACVLCATVRHYTSIIGDFKEDLDQISLSFTKPSDVVGSSGTTGNNSTVTCFITGITDVVGSNKPLKYSYEELLTATNHFSDENRIQGSVFLGKLRESFVAIKQMKVKGNMSDELKILSQVHHGNVVCCELRLHRLPLSF